MSVDNGLAGALPLPMVSLLSNGDSLMSGMAQHLSLSLFASPRIGQEMLSGLEGQLLA
uniref:Uncharacterized protein n=1 Tax=Arundo donax TaxID=35708 RepID=A0A0A9G6S5_ARUDO